MTSAAGNDTPNVYGDELSQLFQAGLAGPDPAAAQSFANRTRVPSSSIRPTTGAPTVNQTINGVAYIDSEGDTAVDLTAFNFYRFSLGSWGSAISFASATSVTGTASTGLGTVSTTNVQLNEQTGFFVPKQWGQFWRPALATAQAGTGKAIVSILGDSIGRGMYATSLQTTSWAGLLTAALQGAHASSGDGGSGVRTIWDSTTQANTIGPGTPAVTYYTGTGDYIAPVGTWTVLQRTGANGGAAAGNYLLVTTDIATPGSITFPGRGTTIVIQTAAKGGLNAAWTYTIDGGAAVPVTDGATGVVNTTITGLAAGTHTVKITCNGDGTKSMFLSAVRFENNNGVVVDNYSCFSQQSLIWGSAAAAASCAYVAGPSRIPNLLIYAMAVNDDAHGAVSAATWAQNVGDCWAECKDALGVAGGGPTGATDILLLMNHIGQYDAGPTYSNRLYSQYIAAAQSLCHGYGAALIDMWAIGRNSWNYWNSLNYFGNTSNPAIAGTDPVHLSNAGHAAVATAVKSLVLPTS